MDLGFRLLFTGIGSGVEERGEGWSMVSGSPGGFVSLVIEKCLARVSFLI